MFSPPTARTLSLLLVCSGMLAGFAGWLFLAAQPADPDGRTQEVTVETGSGVLHIARTLDNLGIVRSALAFAAYAALTGRTRALQAGTYTLHPGMDVPEVVRTISGGDAASRETTITIPEGWTADEIGAYLERKALFPREAWDAVARATDTRTFLPEASFDFLGEKPAHASLEGFLFPDTYRVFRDATPGDVIAKMLTAFGAHVTPDLRAQAVNQDRTFFEMLTLASTVEREVRTTDDRRKVADIFLRRLRAGIPLQSDVTVQYAVGRLDVPPTKDDLAVDSLYNTYRYAGLPPGPVGNPGLDALRAVLDPLPNDFWYFLNTPAGDTIFSRTLDEHNANVATYLR